MSEPTVVESIKYDSRIWGEGQPAGLSVSARLVLNSLQSRFPLVHPGLATVLGLYLEDAHRYVSWWENVEWMLVEIRLDLEETPPGLLVYVSPCATASTPGAFRQKVSGVTVPGTKFLKLAVRWSADKTWQHEVIKQVCGCLLDGVDELRSCLRSVVKGLKLPEQQQKEEKE